ncbi:MAG: hypothetical protein WA447_03375 [Candidatus Binatus sp.]|uniref:hypothetical protein n=1 Tax=Candidatus Binatus sp. TaxID=2811406 RepID=UPI003BB20DAD
MEKWESGKVEKIVAIQPNRQTMRIISVAVTDENAISRQDRKQSAAELQYQMESRRLVDSAAGDL